MSDIGMHPDQAYVPGTGPQDNLYDDTIIWCQRCGEQIEGDTECEYVAVDPNAPVCADCCQCAEHASDRCSEAHTPGTGSW